MINTRAKLNILHIGNIRNQPHNGVCVVVPKILVQQSKIANVTLLNLTNYTPDYSINNYKVLSLEVKKSILKIDMAKYDLIIFHEFYWQPYIRLYKQAIKLGIPYIILPHGSLTKYAQNNKKLKKFIGNKLLFDSFANNASAIQYLSKREKNETVYPKIDSFVVGNGIDLHKERKLSFSEEGVKLIYVGRIDPYIKGLDILIEAINILKQSIVSSKITVTIAGTGAEKDVSFIRDLIEQYKLNKIVILEGGVFGQAKINKILANDCFIQLSRTEAQPLGIIEAMGLGMPVIATPGTTFYETMKVFKCGIPVSSNPSDIASIISDLVNKKYDLTEISAASKKFITDYYNWDKVSQDTIASYSKYVRV